MIQVKIGNIFESNKEILVNTVNCVGVMGKGIAKTFKEKYSKMFDEYKNLCQKKQITTGRNYPYFENGKIVVLNFPTKQHWRSPSTLEYIISGLDWETVGPIMYKKLYKLPIDIEIYAPFGTDKEKLSEHYLLHENNKATKKGIIYDSINDNWLLILQLIKHLSASKYSIKVGRTVFQKICYVLSRYGTDLGLNFVKGTYGPYSSEIKKMITILSNHNLTCVAS